MLLFNNILWLFALVTGNTNRDKSKYIPINPSVPDIGSSSSDKEISDSGDDTLDPNCDWLFKIHSFLNKFRESCVTIETENFS
ncbi:hypothetical protein FQA39_LY00093 [Lamprigera yunnana]|nr:hypothetical protein FQA39_LY00093 [Lamprigera yunnana]